MTDCSSLLNSVLQYQFIVDHVRYTGHMTVLYNTTGKHPSLRIGGQSSGTVTHRRQHIRLNGSYPWLQRLDGVKVLATQAM